MPVSSIRTLEESVFITVFIVKAYSVLRGYFAVGSGNCRLRRQKAQMYTAACKVKERKDGQCNKLTCILNDFVGKSLFRSIPQFLLKNIAHSLLKTDRLKTKHY